MYTDGSVTTDQSGCGSVTTDQSGWGFTVKQGVTTIREDSAAFTVSTSSLTMEVEAVTCALCWTALRGESQTTHAIIFTDLMRFLKKKRKKEKKWKVEWEAQIDMCQCSTSTFKNSCGCTAQDLPEWREMTEHTDWWAKQPSQVSCISENLSVEEPEPLPTKPLKTPVGILPWKFTRVKGNDRADRLIGKATITSGLHLRISKCWGAWDTTYRHKAFENSCGCTALDTSEWREMSEQIDWQAKQPSQVTCFSGALKCWEAWDRKPRTSHHRLLGGKRCGQRKL